MAAQQVPTANPVSARKLVLIVEDNALNMKLFTAMIGAQGHEVVQAADGLSALDQAHRRHPDLIIMDLQLPDMSGLDVMRILKADADTRSIPIIATTAFATRGGEASIRESGCDGYMAKPIAISEFLELIDSLITRSTPAQFA